MTRDRINGLIGAAFAAALIIASLMLPASRVPDDIGPAVFPILAGVMILIPSVYMILKKGSGEEKPFFSAKEEFARFWILTAVFFLYALLLFLFGFIIATPVITVIVSRMFSKGKTIPMWKTVGYAVVLTVLVYAAFAKGLGLKLPAGSIINIAF